MSVITDNKKRRDALTPEHANARLTETMKAQIVALLSDGATLTEVCSRMGFVSLMPVWREHDADENFRNNFRMAQARGAAAILAEAQENLRSVAEEEKGDADKARIAEMYARACTTFAEKHAPKEFGGLLKLAGDAELAAVQVSIVKYGPQDEAPEKPVN